MRKGWSWVGVAVLWAGCGGEAPPPAPPPGPQLCAAAAQAAPPVRLGAAGVLADVERGAYLVRLRPGASGRDAALVEGAGGRLLRRWEALRVVAARLTPAQARALAARPEVASVEPDRPVRALAWGGGAASGLPAAGYVASLARVGAPAVWDADGDGVLDADAPAGAGVRVCVVDSGVDPRHPELAGAVVGGKDFVDDDADPSDRDAATGRWGGGHGTHVAATLAARLGAAGVREPGSPEREVAGVAPGAQLLIARVLDTRGNGNTSDVIDALAWCREQGARVASLSLGSAEASDAEALAVQQAVEGGMLVVAASGNSGTGDPATEPPVAFPAAYPQAIAVGSVEPDGTTHSRFSQRGPQVALVAPGVDVLSASIVGEAAYSELQVAGQPLASRVFEYAPLGAYTGALVDCGLGGPDSACGAGATCEGFVALLERGGDIKFGDKVRHAMAQGARAVVVANHLPEEDETGSFTLTDPEATWVPAAWVKTGELAGLRARLGQPVTVRVAGADYAVQTGTSMATPHVSGVAALLLAARPALTPAQVRALLEDSARDLGPAGKDDDFGHGLVRAPEALALLRTRHP